MDLKKCVCPDCGRDITDIIAQAVAREIRQRNIERVNSEMTPERRKELNRASRERLQKWRKDHPDKAKKNALMASQSRTSESFAKQAESVRATAQRKAMKFAELVFAAKQSGREITYNVEIELMERAKTIVKEENKARKKQEKQQKSATGDNNK